MFFDGSSHFTVMDTWRFWIIHLWVEGFFELFVTVMVAVMFYKLPGDLVFIALGVVPMVMVALWCYLETHPDAKRLQFPERSAM
jgi:nitric oxide reductase large subunit